MEILRNFLSFIRFLILVILIVQYVKADWLNPVFVDPQVNGVNFLSAIGVFQIGVREELPWPFKLAKIHYEGVGKPVLGSFEIGDNGLLGANISKIENEWFITIEKRQDYENPQQRIYSFWIYISGESTKEHGILLTLENIFDNKPLISYSPSPCKVEELHANYLADCVFTVYDPDGMDRNRIKIFIDNKNNEENLFSFIQKGETTTFEAQYKLKIIDALHYEEKSIYSLDVKVSDSNNNTGVISTIIEVIDLPNRDPRWVRLLSTATFNEKTEQFFEISAIDGDTGINKPICYALEFIEDYSDFITINSTSGIVHVSPIDRDELNQQIFTFYTSAYKCDNSSWATKNLSILIVQDVNDHIPEIYLKPLKIEIPEAKYLTLPFDEFVVQDLDLGINATFEVNMIIMNDAVTLDSFALNPQSGYQKTNFSISIINTKELDYEIEECRSFNITIIAQELENPLHSSNRTLQIELKNWNDEPPIFDSIAYEVEVNENISKGDYVAQVKATDRDYDDDVVHSFVGNITWLKIDNKTGVITTSEDNIFDYERQQLVFVQIRAMDTLITVDSSELHTSYAQLSIKVTDINDETPELRLPRSRVNITENSAGLTVLTDKIEAHDPDTTANLTFQLVWSSSYATKNGQEANRDYFVNCFVIETQLVNNNLVLGVLRINQDFGDIDYEKFDTIYLTIKVTDLNQIINADSTIGTLTISIDDVNDNSPQFALNTLQELRKVTEMEAESTIIGTIDAYDIDGPGNNMISYSIEPIGNLTSEGLISIDNKTGVLRVIGEIQCDLPKIYNLEYEIILSDMVHITTGRVNISIVDINNQIPTLGTFPRFVSIYENATSGAFVGKVEAFDLDRDEPHNILEFSINNAVGDNLNFFQINITNGEVTVNLRDGRQLDRDNGITSHYIVIDIKDNFNYNSQGYGAINQISTFLNITLLDVNDNAPIMPFSFAPEFSEADIKGTESKLLFIAEDKDEQNTPNSLIAYRVLSLQPIKENSENVANYSDIFTIETGDQVTGKLTLLKDLKGYFGYWNIEIEAYDFGEPVMRNYSSYEIYVRPYNFHSPLIRYPYSNMSIRICYALQEVNRPLYQADCITPLKFLEAFDPDGGNFGDITFSLNSDSGADQFFGINKFSRNQSLLYLKQVAPAGIYLINLRATDGGGRMSTELRNLKLILVNNMDNPVFLERTFTTNFTENEIGLTEVRYIPTAFDPKNEGLGEDDEQYKLYYFLDSSSFEEDAKYFHLEKESRKLSLIEPLDREKISMHTFRIIVSNDENFAQTSFNGNNNTLDVIISVNDVNDNPPKFRQEFYVAGITTKDTVAKSILELKADDPDLNDTISYQIVDESLEVHGEHIPQNISQFLDLNYQTGVLSLGTYVATTMKGHFIFNVEAHDAADPPHSDIATIKVYIVSESNRVRFGFLSEVDIIREHQNIIREEFQRIYEYEICNIDSIDDAANEKSIRIEDSEYDIVYLTVHFIHNNEAVDAKEIERQSSDVAFVSKLQSALQKYNLILNDVPHNNNNKVIYSVDEWILNSLIGACALLGCICIGVLVIFFLKINSLKRKLKAFDPPKFGSVDSHLNRIAMPTNIFSVEGSNPVFKSQLSDVAKCGAYDQETSSESEEDEFGDLHEDPTFEMNMLSNFEPKPSSFERKVLNNEFEFNEYKTDVVETDVNSRF